MRLVVSVRLFPLNLLSQLTVDRDFCMYMDHDHCSRGIERQGRSFIGHGQELGLGIGLTGW